MPHNSVPYSAGSHRTLEEPVWIGEISCEEFKSVVWLCQGHTGRNLSMSFRHHVEFRASWGGQDWVLELGETWYMTSRIE